MKISIGFFLFFLLCFLVGGVWLLASYSLGSGFTMLGFALVVGLLTWWMRRLRNKGNRKWAITLGATNGIVGIIGIFVLAWAALIRIILNYTNELVNHTLTDVTGIGWLDQMIIMITQQLVKYGLSFII